MSMNDQIAEWRTAKIRDPLPVAAPNSDNEIALGEILGFLWLRKFTLIVCMLLSAIAGAAYVSTVTDLYQSDATLILEEQNKNAIGIEDLLPGLSGEDAEMTSQIQVFKSRIVIGKVVDELNLVEDPEYVEALRAPSVFSRAIGWVKPEVSIATNANDEVRIREDVIDRLIENLSVSLLPETFVFRLRIKTDDPRKSADILNAIAASFIEARINQKKNFTENAAIWLNNKVAELEVSLNDSETKAAAFRSQTEWAVTDQELFRSNQKLKNSRGRYDSFISSLEAETGSKVPRSEQDIDRQNAFLREIAELEAIAEKQTKDFLVNRQFDREAKT